MLDRGDLESQKVPVAEVVQAAEAAPVQKCSDPPQLVDKLIQGTIFYFFKIPFFFPMVDKLNETHPRTAKFLFLLLVLFHIGVFIIEIITFVYGVAFVHDAEGVWLLVYACYLQLCGIIMYCFIKKDDGYFVYETTGKEVYLLPPMRIVYLGICIWGMVMAYSGYKHVEFFAIVNAVFFNQVEYWLVCVLFLKP